MGGAVLFEAAAVAAVAAFMVVVLVRKRSFVLFATLAMFAVMGLEILSEWVAPTGHQAFEDLAWTYRSITSPLDYYRLATHLFVHSSSDGSHIIGNVFTFLLMGWPLEEKIGAKRTMAVFFLTGVLGAVVSSVFIGVTQGTGSDWYAHGAGLGASGAIFGVIGYFAVRYPNEMVLAPLIVVLARVPVRVAAAFALLVQAIVLAKVSNPFIQGLDWPSVLAHLASFVVGMAATRVPSLRAADSPQERAFHLDLSPLRDLVVKPADKLEVEGIIKEDIPEVAQAKLEAFVKRARCPKCQGVLVIDGKKLTSECGWQLEFGRRKGQPNGKA